MRIWEHEPQFTDKMEFDQTSAGLGQVFEAPTENEIVMLANATIYNVSFEEFGTVNNAAPTIDELNQELELFESAVFNYRARHLFKKPHIMSLTPGEISNFRRRSHLILRSPNATHVTIMGAVIEDSIQLPVNSVR